MKEERAFSGVGEEKEREGIQSEGTTKNNEII